MNEPKSFLAKWTDIINQTPRPKIRCSSCGGAFEGAHVCQPEPDHAAEIARLRADLAAMEAEVADLKTSVIAFCGPWAARFARDAGLPAGHLHPTHYDILERCGARMVDFTRALEPPR